MARQNEKIAAGLHYWLEDAPSSSCGFFFWLLSSRASDIGVPRHWPAVCQDMLPASAKTWLQWRGPAV
jgi:hypothetical protein